MSLRIIISALLCIMAIGASGQTTESIVFKHYQGLANDSGQYNANGTQKVHEMHYYYYMKPWQSRGLDLPFVEYSGRGNGHEPKGYFRWFNYTDADGDGQDDDFDSLAGRLTPQGGTGTTLLEKLDGGYGYMAYNKITSRSTNATGQNIGVKYQYPNTAMPEGWSETIACDVSRYIDPHTTAEAEAAAAAGTELSFEHEPTLSIRYVFHIHPLTDLAKDIMESILNTSETNQYSTYEDKKYFDIGVTSDFKGETNFRMNLRYLNLYYFYPLTDEAFASKHIYYPGGYDESSQYKITADDFDTSVEPIQANRLKWRIYDSSMSYYSEALVDAGLRRFNFTAEAIDTAEWVSVATGDSIKNKNISNLTPTLNTMYYIVIYLNGNFKNCPVANFGLKLTNTVPLEFKEVEGTTRSTEYLFDHFTRVGIYSFDESYTIPTTPEENIGRTHIDWEDGRYSFIYADLADKEALYDDVKTYSPYHGDYGLFKSANVSGISRNGGGKYAWYYSRGASSSEYPEIHDRTYDISNGSQWGNFLYVDASEESRAITTADFEANLCGGSIFAFSAAVAHLNHDEEPDRVEFPQVILKLNAQEDDGDWRTLINVASGNLYSVGAVKPYTWYQLYGLLNIPGDIGIEQYTNFRLEIDNYCTQTADGADYAVDDIRMYVRTSIMQSLQDKPVCSSSDEPKLKLRVPYESLLHKAAMNTGYSEEHTIYYRIVNSSTGEPVPQDYDGDGDTEEYGTATFTGLLTSDDANMETVDGTLYYVVTNREFTGLNISETYYISATVDESAPGTPDDAMWGKPNEVCSIYSPDFNIVSNQIQLAGADGSELILSANCTTDEVADFTIQPTITVADQSLGGSLKISNCPYDWYIGATADYTADVQQALHHFRHEYPTETSVSETTATTTTFTEADRTKLISLTTGDAPTLFLAKTSLTKADYDSFAPGNTYNIVVRPVFTLNEEDNLPYITLADGTQYAVCPDEQELKVSVVTIGPELGVGFYDVTYPSTLTRGLRLGLGQLKELAAGKSLYLPINRTTQLPTRYEPIQLQFKDTEKSVVVSSTNDPTFDTTDSPVIFTIAEDYLACQNTETEQRHLTLKLADGFNINRLHEGYWYELNIQFTQTGYETFQDCDGSTFFLMKIVPEYVTWTPTANSRLNNNWSNDLNWRRSSPAELFKQETDYPAYGTTAGYTGLTTQQAYTPMKFTNVVVPTLTYGTYPMLAQLTPSATGIYTILTNGSSPATTDITFDMMMKTEPEADGHYGCEKFYINTCKNIYFKPYGELRHQQFLRYGKAWVDLQVDKNKWYIAGSPVKDVYAGDMYAPSATGQENSEAFEPITFDTSKGHNRISYPIYQRSWDKSATQKLKVNESYVDESGQMGGDALADGLNLTTLNWSFIYNQLDEPYSASLQNGAGTLTGFSIKAGDDYTSASSSQAIIRLPKEDEQYTYYRNDGTASTQTTGKLTRTDAENLVIPSSETAGNTAPLSITLADNTTEGNLYHLLYNPYMSTLSMTAFFADANNSALLEPAFWIVSDQATETINTRTITSQTTGRILPMQGFFVKVKEGFTGKKTVSFNSNMTIDGQLSRAVSLASNISNVITLTASNSAGQSTSRIALSANSDEAYNADEDADLLYSTLTEQLPSVYTVATSRAVSVNTLPEISYLPVGIVSKNAEDATLSFSANQAETLYLYDAESKTYTELNAPTTIKANAHGRYFITTTSEPLPTSVSDNAELYIKCYSPAKGMIVVTTPNAGILNNIRAYNAGGGLVKTIDAQGNNSCSMHLPSGTYLLKVFLNDNQKPKVFKMTLR